MNYDGVDKVIHVFHKALPYGKNRDEAFRDFDFGHREKAEIIKFLDDELIIEEWKHARNSSILTRKGVDIINIHGGIEKYLDFEKSKIEESSNLEKLRNEKLHLDTKLSKLKVKTFWYVFIFGLFGGFYSMYSMIDSFVGESEEQRIERILENKLQERQQKQKTSTYQTNIDSLSIDRGGKK
jgi:hypothetical protein